MAPLKRVVIVISKGKDGMVFQILHFLRSYVMLVFRWLMVGILIRYKLGYQL